MNGKRARICLVTEELSYGKGTGGIGGAFHELALALRHAGHHVDIVYIPESGAPPADMIAYYGAHGIRLLDPKLADQVWEPFTYEKRSYAIFRILAGIEEPYDFIHFHDYRGLGYATVAAKSQGLGFADTTLVVQAHGPTRWAMEANDYPLLHEDQLKIDQLERESVARADVLVSPSAYMLTWMEEHGWRMPPESRRRVLQNICTHLTGVLPGRPRRAAGIPANEIIYFARHEERKGIVQFCDALDLLKDELAAADVRVTFLGGFSVINGEPSALYLTRRSRHWQFRMRIMPDCDRIAAGRYLAENERSVVVVASRFENSPYAVVEAAVAGKPLICSNGGGTPELLNPALIPVLTCEMTRQGLAARLSEAVASGLPPARLAIAPAETARQWLDFHANPPASAPRTARKPAARRPRVTAAITHFERPAKLYDALMSLAMQTYPAIEILVVDDGSRDPATLQALDRLQPLLSRLGARLVRQENRYLGAARNTAMRESRSDYLLFLDDDDIALPNLVSTLVTAAETTGADIVNCLYLYMNEARRHEAHGSPELFREKISHIVGGGPLAATPFDNVFGGATALIRRTALDRLGGYTEAYGVGFEDFELYTKAAQAGMRIEVCPLPLLLYETGRPSMISGTSRLRNWNRVLRAIDVAQQPRAWKDVVSVVAGSRAQEHNRNYFLWWMSQQPEAVLLHRIADEPVTTAAYAGLVQEYALARKAPAMADAMRILAAERAARSESVPPVLMPPLAPRTRAEAEPAAELDVVLLGALIDLSTGRLDDAITGFLRTWSREPEQQPTHGQVRFLKALVRDPALSAMQASTVLRVLEQKVLELDGLREMMPLMFRLALAARDATTALRCLEQARIVDETTYLASHPAVQDAVAAGDVSSGLAHWMHAGDSADPAAFPLLRALRVALQSALGVEVAIGSLRHYIGLLAQGGNGPVSDGSRSHHQGGRDQGSHHLRGRDQGGSDQGGSDQGSSDQGGSDRGGRGRTVPRAAGAVRAGLSAASVARPMVGQPVNDHGRQAAIGAD